MVILNYNGAHFLRQFLPGVLAHADGAQVVVADNASTDDSREVLQREFPAVQVLAFTENLGFCEGYNQALARLNYDFYVLLNSDVAVRPGWLPPLRQLLAQHPRAAAAQPKILAHANPTLLEYAGAGGGYLDALAYPFCRGRLFDTLETDRGQYDDPRPVAWASGACCLVRASAWRALGGFEPAFFAHMEEIDFCWRAQNAGYEVWYAGGASVVEHVGGGTLPKSNPRKTYLNFRNGLALLFKNTAPGELAPSLILRLLLDWVAGLRLLAAGNWPEARAVGRAHAAFFLRLGYWRRRRKLAAPRLLLSERAGTYAGSVVWAYFGQGKKRFADLSITAYPSAAGKTN
ncbi:glycosyltransferase family 2 protein [Hymenobacter sp. RP-2-7]|uniref:Glycosyltransferase family 2 protein n=1 Tax=Hymenobacter polaris TaxID=2682546 RepID=A0A7Y0AAG5_9BACT|nr:glycosyltransferase family 2 protein [Hymenobacter polaris]